MKFLILFYTLIGLVFCDLCDGAFESSGDRFNEEEVTETFSFPENPMLPDFMSFQKHIPEIARQINVVDLVRNMAKDLGKDLQKYHGRNPHEYNMKIGLKISQKFSNLVYFIDTMSAEQIIEAGDYIYTPHNQDIKNSARAQAWLAYRDAVFQSGTKACATALQKWVKTYKLQEIKPIL